MESKIKNFESLQKKILGFIRYKIRTIKNDYFVDVYMENGLLIKTKKSYVTEKNIIDFIEEYSQVIKLYDK
ncbi:hypothetical protein KAR91_48665 [Candidatus Pacearchaeota archaeon]|nr:hypothetical protein [Candidatus Pacearchaeota archaeon]